MEALAPLLRLLRGESSGGRTCGERCGVSSKYARCGKFSLVTRSLVGVLVFCCRTRGFAGVAIDVQAK